MVTRLSGGLTPADGADPRTFPAIWNATATNIEAAESDIDSLQLSVNANGTAIVALQGSAVALGSAVDVIEAWDLDDLNDVTIGTAVSDGQVLAYSTAVSGWVNAGAAKILQVVSTSKTDAFTTNSTSLVEITGLSASITPVSTSSKILVLVSGLTSISTNTNSLRFRLKRDSTYIGQSTGGTSANFSLALFPAVVAAGVNFSINFLDSPSSTSALDYQVDMSVSGGDGYINRNSASTAFGSITTITLMEVAG